MGYKIFKVVQTGDIDKSRTHCLQLDTGAFEVAFDENTGLISKIYSRVLNKTFENLLKPQCFEDISDAEGFLETTYGKPLENFSLIGIETVEQGALRTVLKVNYKFRNSMLSLYYSFYTDEDYFDVKYYVNWNEKQIVLKLMLKTDYQTTIVASPFASETREDCESDTPMGEWLSIYDQNEGISLIADSTFAYTKQGSTLGLSILRSCIYTDLRMDKNPLPNEDVKSFVSVNSESVLLAALKKAEDDDSEIIRLSEIAGQRQEVILTYFDTEFMISINPYEIKTLKINGRIVNEVNIVENEI